jgi:hypothetical protein
LAPERSFSNLLCKYIGRRYVKSDHLDFNGITAIFLVDRQKSLNFEVDVESLVNGMNEGSFNVFSFYEMELIELQRTWIQKKLYSMSCQIAKEEFEGYVQYLHRFLELIDTFPDEDLHKLLKRMQCQADMDKLDFFM